jgi:ADP-dependent NAD(P)H-hydrate dehydratase / NAD(P)H-hydrate epimerase
MLAVVGTVPDDNFPLLAGKVTLEDGDICIQGRRITVNRGTPALLAAAVKVGEALGQEEPFGYLVGDIGRGDGSKRLYQYLVQHLKQTDFHTICFHYLQPLVGWHSRIQSVIKKMIPKPILIADAGFMYVAKMSGRSDAYDLFTPDVGELAFLADEVAPHPFYTRGFILHEENHVPDLITRAYAHGNAARNLLVKGKKDYVANKEGVQAVIDEYSLEAMEAIGGTGDTLTGVAAALITSGMEVGQAAILAAQVNRLAGHYAQPSPGSQVSDIIQYIPKAFEEMLKRQKNIMSEVSSKKDQRVTPDMTVLNVIDRYRNTEAVFRKYDDQAGVCICCQALFDTIEDMAAKYRLNLDQLLLELEDAIHL